MKPNKHLASLALLFLGFAKALGQNWDKSGTDLFAPIFQVTQRYTLSRRFCPMTSRQPIRLDFLRLVRHVVLFIAIFLYFDILCSRFANNE